MKIESQERFYKVQSKYMLEMVKLVFAFFWRSCDFNWICYDIFTIWVRTVLSGCIFLVSSGLRGSSAEVVDGDQMAENRYGI